ncbi:MAG: glycosyltransferase [Candidatus Sericytochromatia bacterium]|nr:glycosyltransferase [Candidatus Sericytochromatia bacterium]
MAAARTTVVIVSWNTRGLLEACLRRVYAARPGTPVVVVDNASSDGTVEALAPAFPQATWLPQAENLGFARGNNVGLAGVATEFVWLLNPDTEPGPDALAALEGWLDTHPEAAAVGAGLLNPDGSPQPCAFQLPTAAATLAEWCLLPGPLARLRDRLWRLGPRRAAGRTGWVLGAAMLVRASVLREVGGLREDFFMYAEELEWCRRATQAGWEVHLAPEADVVHHGGAATSQVREAMRVALFESRGRYMASELGGARRTTWLAIAALVAAWNTAWVALRRPSGWTPGLAWRLWHAWRRGLAARPAPPPVVLQGAVHEALAPLIPADADLLPWGEGSALPSPPTGEPDGEVPPGATGPEAPPGVTGPEAPLLPGAGDWKPGEGRGGRPRVSAVLIARNEATRLPGCLEALQASGLVDEVVVVDDASTDGSAEVAARAGARVLVHPHVGENWDLNKNVGMDAARGDWVLLIDADERLAPGAAATIARALAGGASCAAYWLPRQEWYFGRWARHATAGARVLRLVRRGAVRFEGERLHAHPRVDGPVGQLAAALVHEPYPTIGAYVAKTWLYTDHEARVRHAAGERAGLGEVLAAPLRHLWHRGWRQQGWRDGWAGLVYCVVTVLYPTRQAWRLWRLGRRDRS